MRAYLALALIVLPGVAAAAPSLQCSYEGNKTKIVIVNSERTDKQCEYVCSYTIKHGWIKVFHRRQGVRAGETHTREGTHDNKIDGVAEISLQCE